LEMKTQLLKLRLPSRRAIWLLGALLVVIAGVAIGSLWRHQILSLAASGLSWAKVSGSTHDVHNEADAHAEGDVHAEAREAAGGRSPLEAEHDHEKEAPDAHDAGVSPGLSQGVDHQHDETAAVKLSQTAQGNVGLQLAKVELRSFEKTITTPAMVVERPGRSLVQVAAPLTGVVTRVRPLQGETVTPGQPIFDLRLTHEEVVEGQTQYLRTAEELDVVQREIGRLERVTADGAIAGKTLLERQYEKQKLDGIFRAQRQGLLLHGLSNTQVDEIVAKRALVSEMTVAVPETSRDQAKSNAPQLLQIEELKVSEGQHVNAGDPLCVLADYTQLYVQGKAFEQDAAVLNKAANNDWPVAAVIDANGQERQAVPGLQIVYLANKIEPDSRAFVFYVELPNQVVRNYQRPDGHRFTAWRFKPGQRVDLLVPVEQWTNRIVLPVEAVVQDGAESYVFEQNDGHFDRRAVRVEYRDEFSVVVANDGTLTPGKMIIVSGSYQVHLAMKNKAGGAPDPHAGHNH
jgi:multidrug efflux pump subunit AcrA (membrane-fusion protein)